MSKNNLNLNNKFGECCGCPPLSDNSIIFTNYVSSRIHNDVNSKLMGALDSHSYRSKLQKNASKLIENNINAFENIRCTSDIKNKFYIDSSNYNFNYNLPDGYWGQSIINNGTKKSDHCKI